MFPQFAGIQRIGSVGGNKDRPVLDGGVDKGGVMKFLHPEFPTLLKAGQLRFPPSSRDQQMTKLIPSSSAFSVFNSNGIDDLELFRTIIS